MEFYKNKYGFISSNDILETPRGRLCWVRLKTPSEQSKKYGLTLLFPKDESLDKDTKNKLRKLQAIGHALIKEAGKDADGMKRGPILDGDKLADDKYADLLNGHFYISLTNKNVPTLVDINKKKIGPEEFANGMIVKAAVQAAFYKSGGPGISYTVHSLMKIKDDGVRFSGSVDGVSILSDEEETEDNSGLDSLGGAPATVAPVATKSQGAALTDVL